MVGNGRSGRRRATHGDHYHHHMNYSPCVDDQERHIVCHIYRKRLSPRFIYKGTINNNPAQWRQARVQWRQAWQEIRYIWFSLKDMRSMEVIQVKDAKSGYWIRGRVTLDQIIKEGKMCIELKSVQCRWLIWYAFMQYLSRCFSCAIACTELDTPRSSQKSNTADCTK